MNEIKKHRTIIGVSQIKLAISAGVSRFNLWMHEKELKRLSSEDLQKVEKALGQFRKELKRQGDSDV